MKPRGRGKRHGVKAKTCVSCSALFAPARGQGRRRNCPKCFKPRPRSKALAVPTEHQEQVAFFEHVDRMALTDLRYRCIFAVCNGARVSIGTARKLVREGLKRGVPDVVVAVPNGVHAALYIECKRASGSRVSDEQLKWLSRLRGQGNAAVVAYGAEEAIHVLGQYFKGDRISG